MNAAHERVLVYFEYSHLPEDLQRISKPIGELAYQMADELQNSTDGAEVTVGLRKLLEAKDAFVRAALKRVP